MVLSLSDVALTSNLFFGNLGLFSFSDKLSIKFLLMISPPSRLLAIFLFFLFLNLCLLLFEYKTSSNVSKYFLVLG